MTFLTPALAIAGVLAIAIPIAIHLLFRQRRKPIEWAAMRFLLEAFRKHKRRLRLEQILLLTVRCLIVALLGAALARPVLEAAGIIPAGGSRTVYLVIDDGMVSGVTDEGGATALSRHVKQAVDLVNTLGPGDSVGLITASQPARLLLSPPSTDRAAVVNLIQGLQPKESPTDLAAALGLLRTAVADSSRLQSATLGYLFSEFRSGSAALDVPLPPTANENDATVKLLASAPAAEPVRNVQVDAIEPVRSFVLPGANDGSGQVTVRLSRSGDISSGEVSSVRLVGDGLAAIEPKIVRWQAGQAQADVKFMVSFPASVGGIANDRTIGLSAMIDDDALNADNRRHTVLELREQIRVLMIDRRSFGAERSLDQLTAGQWIRRALEPRMASHAVRGASAPLGGVQIVEVEPAALSTTDLRTADVAVLPRPDLLTSVGWNALREFVNRDGIVIVMPPGDVNVHQWTESFTSALHLPFRVSLEVVQHETPVMLAEEQPQSEFMRLVSSDLADLARPVIVQRSLPMIQDSASTSAFQPILLFADGTPAMVVGRADRSGEASGDAMGETTIESPSSGGLIFYLAVAPELSWTNLPSKPLMVPLFHEAVRQGLSVVRASKQWQVGEQPNLGQLAAHELVGPTGGSVNSNVRRIAVDQRGRPQEPLEQAGVYVMNDQMNHALGKVAINIDAAAGSTDVQSAAAVASWLKASGPWATFDANSLPTSLAVDRSTSPVAGILLLIVLALVIIETLLARRFSHAYASTETFGLGLGKPAASLRHQASEPSA